MKKQNLVKTGSKVFVGISILSVGSVGILSLLNPQGTMDLVQVQLSNNDALSSIRGVFGGVGITLTISLLYLYFTNLNLAVKFLTLFWGLYAFSRLITILVDGSLGAFGNQWILIETFFFLIGILFTINLKNKVYGSGEIS